jgi:hydrogenase maturation protein HypF
MSRKSVAVQHHHAHAISCALDAGVELPVIAVVCDGSGYGLDRAIWGGEVLCCEAESFVRLAHLDYFPLPGGEAAIRSPWRSAMGVVNAAMPEDWSSVSVPTFSGVDAQQRRIATRQLETGCDTIPTSSLGRLFDAVAVLLELCRDDTPDGQAAGALEALAGVRDCPPYRLTLDGLALALSKKGTSVRLNWRPMMREMMANIARGVDPSVISARFHATIVTMLAEAAEWGVRTTGIDRVVLSGGCFANQRLRTGLIAELRMRGIEAKTHVRVPTGDAGISLGQAFVASSVVAGTGGVRAPAFTPGGIRPA